MVERLAACFRRLDEYSQVRFDLGLADELIEELRSQMRIRLILRPEVAINQAVAHAIASSRRARRISCSDLTSSPTFFIAALTAAPACIWP